MQKADEIVAQIGLKLGRRLVLGRILHLAHALVLLDSSLQRGALLGRYVVAEHHVYGHVLLQPFGRVQRAHDQISHGSEQEQHQRDADRRNDVGVAHPALDSLILVHSHSQ